jgi:hypothetical protein
MRSSHNRKNSMSCYVIELSNYVGDAEERVSRIARLSQMKSSIIIRALFGDDSISPWIEIHTKAPTLKSNCTL